MITGMQLYSVVLPYFIHTIVEIEFAYVVLFSHRLVIAAHGSELLRILSCLYAV